MVFAVKLMAQSLIYRWKKSKGSQKNTSRRQRTLNRKVKIKMFLMSKFSYSANKYLLIFDNTSWHTAAKAILN